MVYISWKSLSSFKAFWRPLLELRAQFNAAVLNLLGGIYNNRGRRGRVYTRPDTPRHSLEIVLRNFAFSSWPQLISHLDAILPSRLFVGKCLRELPRTGQSRSCQVTFRLEH